MSTIEKNLRKQVYSLIYIMGALLCLMFIVFSTFKIQFYEICFPLVIFFFIYCVVYFRNKQLILFIDFYIFFYFLYLFYYFYQGSQLSEHLVFQKKYLFERSCLFFYIFYYVQFCIIKRDKKQIKNKITLIRDNKIELSYISNLCIIVFAFILLLLTFRIGTDMIRNGFSYLVYMQNLQASSVMPSLFIIMFALYAFSKRANKYLCYCFAIAYLYFCLSRGFRITAIPALLILYLVLFEGKISNFVFITILFAGVIFILVFGELKDTGTFNISNLFNNQRGGIVISHHADILYTVNSTIGLADDGIISSWQRFCLGVAFFMQAILLPSWFPATLRYPLVISHFTRNGGGGLFLAGSYLFWGFPGVILASYLIILMIIRAYNTNSLSLRVGMAIVLVFCCNWISYDFHTILRFPVYALIVLWFLTHIKWRYLKNA